MNTYQFARIRLTFGKENMEKLYNARVIVFGIGGVGSYVVEALVRSGIGAIDIVDDDRICLTNLNRQLYACVLQSARTKLMLPKSAFTTLTRTARLQNGKPSTCPTQPTSLIFLSTIIL